MDIISLEKLAEGNDQGLVLMGITEAFAPYDKGAIAGFPPEEALRLMQYQVAVPIDKNGQPLHLEPVVVAQEPVAHRGDKVEIPDNWDKAHHLPRMRIAKEIIGSDDPIADERARQIIAAEIARRERTTVNA